MHPFITYHPFILLAEFTLTPDSISFVTAARSPKQAASRNDSSIMKPTIDEHLVFRLLYRQARTLQYCHRTYIYYIMINDDTGYSLMYKNQKLIQKLPVPVRVQS